MRDYLPYPYTLQDAEEFILYNINLPCPAINLAIDVDGDAVGGIGIILKRDVERICAELGYWLGEKYWNRGIMTGAIKQMIRYVFANFSLHKIYATPFDFNIGSHKVLEKSGFELEGVLKRSAVKNGRVVDLWYYGVFSDS